MRCWEKGVGVGWERRRNLFPALFCLGLSLSWWKNEVILRPGNANLRVPHPLPRTPAPVLRVGGSRTIPLLFSITTPAYLTQGPSGARPTAPSVIWLMGPRGGARAPWHTQNPKTPGKSLPFLQGRSRNGSVACEHRTALKILRSSPGFPTARRSKSVIERRGGNIETTFRSKHNGSRRKQSPAGGLTVTRLRFVTSLWRWDSHQKAHYSPTWWQWLYRRERDAGLF